MDETEFRDRQLPPAKSGWYWARLDYEGDKWVAPVLVLSLPGVLGGPPPSGELRVFLQGTAEHSPLDHFIWFGPVAMIKEGLTHG